MKWINLTTEEQLSELIEKSSKVPQVIFKHSTSCSISKVALQRMEKETEVPSIAFYYLDLFKYRPLSNKVAELFKVHHESPQVLLIKDGSCIYDESHMAIRLDEIVEQAGV